MAQEQTSINYVPTRRHGFRVFLMLIALVIFLGVGYYHFIFVKQPKDPFAKIEPESFGTKGKITSIDENAITFDAAVSSVRDGKSFISYESRKAILSENVKIYTKAGDKLNPATLDNLSINLEISVSTPLNPNSNKEFPVTEIVIY
ncbi:MAG: hypothetical protein KW793_02050 [Candidatus Doudnabacteria bacterium]|nr:hypothetical protein [Candidatus Doudnabacteria bacterium]